MNAFNIVAFCILMDHHGEGVEQAHPDYVIEKFKSFSFDNEEYSVSLLDNKNKRRLRDWCKIWGYPMPPKLIQ